MPPSRSPTCVQIHRDAPQAAPATRPRVVLVGAGMILLAACLPYLPVMHGGWQWDDDTSITANASVLGAYSFSDVWIARHSPDYFPLTTTMLWLEWHAFGNATTGYHVVSMLLHAAASILLWRLLAVMRIPGAWLAGLLFAVHPLCVESVAWISELKNTLTQPLFLLAAIHWVRADEQAETDQAFTAGATQWALALFCFLMAMFAKTSVVMFPVVILLHAWWKRGAVSFRDILRAAPFFLVSLLLGLVTIWFQHGRAIGAEVIPVGGPASRFAIAGMAIPFYLSKILLPIGLLPIYPRWQVDPPHIWQFISWPCLAALAAACWFNRRTWGRQILFAGGFFLIMILPVLGFITISYMRISWVADHFVYLPMISIVALLAAAITTAAKQLTGNARHAATAATATIVLLLAIASFRDAAAWVDEGTLWQHTLRTNPDAWQAHNRLGVWKLNAGDLEAAFGHFQASTRLRPDLAETHNNLGVTLLKRGDNAGAEREFRAAMGLQKNAPLFLRNHAEALVALNRSPEAIKELTALTAASPGDTAAGQMLADLYANTSRHPEAEAEYQRILSMNPQAHSVRKNLASLLVSKSRFAAASEQLGLLAQAMPNDPGLHNSLGVCLVKCGRLEEGIAELRRAIALAPDFKQAKENLDAVRAPLNSPATTLPGVPGVPSLAKPPLPSTLAPTLAPALGR